MVSEAVIRRAEFNETESVGALSKRIRSAQGDWQRGRETCQAEFVQTLCPAAWPEAQAHWKL